jgi:hypothetical protein
LQAARYCQPICSSLDEWPPAAALDAVAMPMFLPRPGRSRFTGGPSRAGLTAPMRVERFGIAA